MQRGGEAARAIGEGGAALTAGVDALAGSGKLQRLLNSAPAIAEAAQRGANVGARR